MNEIWDICLWLTTILWKYKARRRRRKEEGEDEKKEKEELPFTKLYLLGFPSYPVVKWNFWIKENLAVLSNLFLQGMEAQAAFKNIMGPN